MLYNTLELCFRTSKIAFKDAETLLENLQTLSPPIKERRSSVHTRSKRSIPPVVMLFLAAAMLVLSLMRMDNPANAEGASASQTPLGASLPFHRYVVFVASDSAPECSQVQVQSASIVAADQVSVSQIAKDQLVADQLIADGKNVGIGMVIGRNQDWVTAWSEVYGSTQVQAAAHALTGCETSTPVPSATPSPRAIFSSTVTPTVTGTLTVTPSPTATKTGTVNPSPSPSATPTGTVSPSATSTSTGTATATATSTSTGTATATATSTSTSVPSVSPSPTPTRTSTPTPTQTPTNTPTPPPVSCTSTPGTTYTATNGDSLTIGYSVFCPGDVVPFDLTTPDVATGATIKLTMDMTEYPRNAANPAPMSQAPACPTSGKCWHFSFTALASAPCEGNASCLPGQMAPDTTKTHFVISMQITTSAGGRPFTVVVR